MHDASSTARATPKISSEPCSCSMVLLTVTVLLQRDRIGNDTILLFAISACLLTWLGRTLVRVTLEWMHWHGRNLCHLLLVGSNQRTYDFIRRITAKPHLGYHLVGYVDDPPTGQRTISSKASSRTLGRSRISIR